MTKDIDLTSLSREHTEWVYNALDSAITYEVWDKVHRKLNPRTKRTYDFARALQGPAMEMMWRGIRVDLHERKILHAEIMEIKTKLEARLDQMALALWDKPLNARSPKQLAEFFYDFLRLPKSYKRGSKSPTTDENALLKLESYFLAGPFCRHILEIRQLGKLADSFSKTLDNGRAMTRINVAGTETGRFSSSESVWGTGTNMQNQTERTRRIYLPDPGKKFAYIDLEQAESRAVGIICAVLGFGDAYLNACSSGDLHTTVTRMVWPEREWTGELAHDKGLAEQVFYRHFSYRDMAKRGGHGTNYYGKAPTMAKHLKVETALVAGFQKQYFAAFPEINLWHQYVADQLQTTGRITSIMGRERKFLGRVYDDATLREAIAYDPQSSIGDYMNLGMLYVHHEVPEVDILLQVHDAILIQYPEEDEAVLLPRVTEQLLRPRLGTPELNIVIPNEVQVGWNWSKVDKKKKFFSDGNPYGLEKWNGVDERKYQEPSILDRRIR